MAATHTGQPAEKPARPDSINAHTLAERLAQLYARRIRDRLLAAGTRLPSVRQCAQQQGVSPSTVVAAYDLLQAQGLVESRPHRGFFVRERSVLRPRAPRLPPAPAPIDAAGLIRAMFHDRSRGPQPGAGAFPPDWLQTSMLASALRRVSTPATLNAASLHYGDPAGDPGLRRVLADQLADIRLQVAPSQVLTTLGASQALDVVSRALLRPGDPVMVEEPGWAVEFARLGALGMRILPVPRGPEGPDLAVMARYCEAYRPRLYVSVSVLHNPTGCSLTPGCAHRVLQLAEQYDFHIVEDDTYRHLAPDDAVRLCALDELQRTIYVGGFSKVMAPGWRIGYLAAPEQLAVRLLDTKLLSTLTTPSLMERALAACIERGQLHRHVQRMRARLDAARARVVRQAQSHGCQFVTPPAGMFGWVETGVDTDALAQRLLDQGYLTAPGSLFLAQHQRSTRMRINFATSSDPAFWRAYVQARDALKDGVRGASLPARAAGRG